MTALRGLAGEYARYALAGTAPYGAPHDAGHGAPVWAAWYVGWSLIVLFPDGLLALLLLLFPDGRLLTRRWRAVAWAAAGLAGFFLVLTWLTPEPVSIGGGVPDLPNPTAVAHLSRWLYGSVGGRGAAAAQVVRLGRGREPGPGGRAAAGAFLRHRRAGGLRPGRRVAQQCAPDPRQRGWLRDQPDGQERAGADR